MSNMNNNMRFGVNYVPSRDWWYRWIDWDSAAVAADLRAIAGIGMDHIRIHCLWTAFQPNAGMVSPAMVGRLRELLDIADDCDLDVSVAVLDGWLSGFSFYPAWVGDRNLFTDDDVVAAQKNLFRELAASVGNHHRFLGFDLGNELGCLQAKGHPVTPAQADDWQAAMFAVCEESAPGRLHVNGVDHNHWFSDAGFSRRSLANIGSMTSVHAWIEFTGALQLYGHLDPGCIELPAYCIELAKAYSDDPHRQVWLQEFGATKCWMPEGDIPEFAERTIRSVARCGNVWGATWWCSHDIDPRLKDFNLIEYDMGLLDGDNNLKPVGARIAKLIGELRANPPAIVPRPKALVLSDGVFSEMVDPPGWQFASVYMDHVKNGIAPSIVLKDRRGDQNYLEKRGISELLN